MQNLLNLGNAHERSQLIFLGENDTILKKKAFYIVILMNVHEIYFP